MDIRPILASTVICLTLFHCGTSRADEIRTKQRAARIKLPAPHQRDARLALVRQRLIAKMRASRSAIQRRLSNDERQLARETAEYEAKRAGREDRFIRGAEVKQSAVQVARTRVEIRRLRQQIADDDAAIGLLGPSPRRARVGLAVTPGGYFVSRAFIRYNGEADWSLDDAGKIGWFFLEHFGRPLPISAMGQTSTHDRMGLDHREALDVAVRPNSAEGRGLMAYLRAAQIPFMAFMGKIPGMATGAHIHIGRPSLKMLHVKALANPAESGAEEGAG